MLDFYGIFPVSADDGMAILMAFQTPELEILGLTTIFGNVTTEDATQNALLLVCMFVCWLILHFIE